MYINGGERNENGSDCVQSGHKLYPRKERIDEDEKLCIQIVITGQSKILCI